MVRKIIDKSHRQNVKQVVHVKVNIGDKKKVVRRKRKPRSSGSAGGVSSHSPYLQPFNPVYIQSGNPPHLSGLPEPNRLVQSIIDEPKPKIVEKHKEIVKNPLLHMANPDTPVSRVTFSPRSRGFGGRTGDSDVDSDAVTVRLGNPNTLPYYAAPTSALTASPPTSPARDRALLSMKTQRGVEITPERRAKLDANNARAKVKRDLEKKRKEDEDK